MQSDWHSANVNLLESGLGVDGAQLSNRVILVTGGAGYIGSHTCKALAGAGYIPVVFDNLAYGHDWAVKWGPFRRGDILDRSSLDAVIAEHNPHAVIHFAAFAYVGESVADPGKYYRNNVVGSLNLLEAARDHGIRRIVFSSTCATYGVPELLPITEDTPLRPINPYGASKLMVERMIRDFVAAHELDAVILRYFNAAGADPGGEIGEDHDPETHIIPLVLDAAAGARSHVTIFGDDYDTADGTCIRDYVHVTDLAKAHVKALCLRSVDSAPAIFNLGNGKGFSVREVINAAERVTGRRIPVRIGKRREGDPPSLVASSQRAKSVLGWTSERSALELIIADAWSWRQKRYSHLSGLGNYASS